MTREPGRLCTQAILGIGVAPESPCVVIGPSENAPDAYHAFGFSGHGFQLSLIVGRLIAECIVDRIESMRSGR